MTSGRYVPWMRGGRAFRIVAAAGTVVALLASCSDDDASSDTLGPIDDTGTVSGASTPDVTGDTVASVDTVVDPADAGSGFVSIQVRLPAAGIDETISLDRATVLGEALDPVSLDATCTPLDGGDEMVVSVVDLRRLAAGARLVSAALQVEGGTSAGQHAATLDVSGADQVTTSYTGTVELADGGWSGTFDTTDESGKAATGTFVCADAPVATTTLPVGGGEEVPDTTG
jgi:hypothetical protein